MNLAIAAYIVGMLGGLFLIGYSAAAVLLKL